MSRSRSAWAWRWGVMSREMPKTPARPSAPPGRAKGRAEPQIRAREREGVFAVESLPRFENLPDAAAHAGDRLRGEQIGDRLADERLGGGVEDPGARAVDEDDAPLPIDDEDRVVGRLGERA